MPPSAKQQQKRRGLLRGSAGRPHRSSAPSLRSFAFLSVVASASLSVPVSALLSAFPIQQHPPQFADAFCDHRGNNKRRTCRRARARTSSRVALAASDLLYQEQERLLVERGELEETMMKGAARALEANKVKTRGTGKAGGFGGGGRSSSNNTKGSAAAFKMEGKAHAKVLKKDGVVRIDDVLSASAADALRELLYNLRATAEQEVASGSVPQQQRFADVLLRKDRCDLTVPVGNAIITEALDEVLRCSSVGSTISSQFTNAAVLHELSCLMSDPGSQRQVIHPDTPVLDGKGPVLFTCFIALQDVRLDMGPTTWLPGTHTMKAHAAFQDTSGPKDDLIQTTPAVLGLLPKGCCAIFDSRCLHCGTANQSKSDSRALFYFSFKLPAVGYPGNPPSIRPELGAAQVTLEQLLDDLACFSLGNGQPLMDELSERLR